MDNRRLPIGIELVKRGLVTENDIEIALNYQKAHPNKKLGDILNTLKLCDPNKLINAIGEILEEKPILLTPAMIRIDFLEYVSMDVAEKNRAIPFEIIGNRIKVCFADTANQKAVDTIKLLLLNKGLMMEKYITFESNILDTLKGYNSNSDENINVNRDMITLVDSIIKNAMEKRASDVHFEPLEDSLRVRCRIDGELITIATIPKDKQDQLIGRLKAISNMHQEKQESQEGRIISYDDYNIRASSQRNIYGEKIVLRLLKKNEVIKGLFDLGFTQDEKMLKKSLDKRNSITIIAAPTGEGKTTTLYSIIDYLNRPQINVTTIEDPVEIRIPGLNQIEIDGKISFSGSLRTVLRQDPDIVLLGEIRDHETAEIALQAGQTGHYVLSTIHTIDAVEALTRLRKLDISNYDIASTVATLISQRLVRKVCPHCATRREFTEEEKNVIKQIGERYNIQFNIEGKTTFDVNGCDQCNKTGYFDRIGVFEILVLDNDLKQMIAENASSLEIKKAAEKKEYRPMVIDAISKVLSGVTTLEEINRKLLIY